MIISDDNENENINNEIEENNNNNSIINRFIVRLELEAKIKDKEEYSSGIGVLCNIPIKNIKALITFNKIINKDFLNKTKKLILYIDNKEIEIDMSIDRYKCTLDELNITIIEILDKDNINKFIEIDKFINSRNYTDSDIVNITLKGNTNFDLSNCKIIKRINNNYICSIESNKEGIIILKENYKLIGLINNNEIIPMNIIINKINFIKCIYIIKKEDIGKDIQIINNKHPYIYNINKEIEKEIRMIINGELKSKILKYKFDKDGDYIIYIISYNNLTDMSHMFCDCSSLKELSLSSFNTNQVTNMHSIFYNCTSLKELNLSSFITNQVTNMHSMFRDCSSLKELNLSSFDISKVTNMSYMFSDCSSLKELNISSFKTNQVTNMSYMFSDCSALKELNLSLFKTNQVTNMSYMFYNCSSLKELNLSSFNTNQVIDMSYMFCYCSSLNILNLSSFDINKVTSMSEMFRDCSSLKELNLLSFKTNQVTNMSHMFYNCSSLKVLNLSSFKTNQLTNMSHMFYNCSSLEELNISSFKTNKVTIMQDIFNSIKQSCNLKYKDDKILEEFNKQKGCLFI